MKSINVLAGGIALKKSTMVMMIFTLTGCGSPTISDIAYDRIFRSDYTVYIKENDEYAPYLVLTNNYNGNTLLLRQYLLDETRAYKETPEGMVGWARRVLIIKKAMLTGF